MSLDSSVERVIKILTLRNALEYDGKAKLEAVISKTMASRPDLRSSIRSIIPEVMRLLNQINSLGLNEQRALLQQMSPTDDGKKQIEKGSSSLPPLYGAEMGKVVTRFPPEPNGYPHIGHAKAAIIDDEYARMYNGRFILRFDDTNPLAEKAEYYEAIKEGIEWLGIRPDIIKNASDDIYILQDYGKKLVMNRGAYVCRCDQKTLQDLRAKGLECVCRSEVDDIKVLTEMFNGSYEPNEATIRFKGDMGSLNTVMRDPTLFRIIEGNHPLLGTSIRVYPTYDFAAPVEDSLDGVTHAMRTKEYELRNELYNAILDRLHLRKPFVSEFSRLEFEGLPVSKRKIKPLIENNSLTGWDDPRLPTLVALKRRGFLPEAIRKYVLSLGWTLSESKPPFESLEAFNRRIIDDVSMRLFFVRDPIELKIRDARPVNVALKNHPSARMGSRTVNVTDSLYIASEDANKLSVGSIIRLMELYNVKITDIQHVGGKAHLDADMIGTDLSHEIQKIQWIASGDKIPYSIIIPKKLFSNEEFDRNSLQIARGYAESFVSTLPLHTSVQFVRYGFCRLDDDKQAIFTHR